jgi:hypothetical protein
MKNPNDTICRCCDSRPTAFEGLRHLLAMLEKQEQERKQREERCKTKPES